MEPAAATFSMPDPVNLTLLLVGLSLAPFLIMMMTSYIKLVVIFNLIRNALGVQQIPPSMVLNGLAIILTLYIMGPVFQDVYNIIEAEHEEGSGITGIFETVKKAKGPVQNFLMKHSKERERKFFIASTKMLWPEDQAAQVRPDDLLILIPAFTVSELTAAFQIGFLIYLPFIIVDLIISNILLAMGMMMVSPMTISLPFKLLLFVLISGWSRVIQGIILTYQ